VAIDVEALYKKYGPMVLRRCRQLLKNEETALDAMQDTFVKVLNRKESLKMDAPSSLLYTIATNTCLNILRSRARKPESQNDEILLSIAGADDAIERIWVRDVLDTIFRKERVSTKSIAVMHYLDGMTLEEVAEESGLSVSGVRKRLRTLRSRVKELKEVIYE
jgi:RNA polymerase sigma-70 factor (ECF subfamily)